MVNVQSMLTRKSTLPTGSLDRRSSHLKNYTRGKEMGRLSSDSIYGKLIKKR
jgi:hypothetical protein